MNKAEIREITKARTYAAIFEKTRDPAVLAMIARTMGTLIRSTRSDKSRVELHAIAAELQVSGHSDFIVSRW